MPIQNGKLSVRFPIARGKYGALSTLRSVDVAPRLSSDGRIAGKVICMLIQSVVILAAILLVILAVACWASNIIGLPGNWLVVALAATYSYFMPDERRLDIGVSTVVGLFALAALGELIEFLAGALGASKAGASKRGTALALAGSLLGGIAGIFVPIPVVGQIVGPIVCAGLGALVGAVIGEQWKGRDLEKSLNIGQAAFWGRLIGTLGKTLVGCVMLVLVIASLFIR